MAFGDSGRFVFSVEGVPFRMDGTSPEEAYGRLTDMLKGAPELIDSRAQRLGLSQQDVDALKIRSQVADGEDPDAPLRGKAQDPLDAANVNLRPTIPGTDLGFDTGMPVGQSLGAFLTGAGQTFTERYRGMRQMAAQWAGDDAAAASWVEMDHNEKELWNQLDSKSMLADLGQITPDVLALMLPGTLPFKAAQGVLPVAALGAMLGAAEVQKDPTAASRLKAAGLGAVGAFVPAAVGAAGKYAYNTVKAAKAGVSVRMGNLTRILLRKGLQPGSGRLTGIVGNALDMIDSNSEAMRTLGRATLDRVKEIVGAIEAGAPKSVSASAAKKAGTTIGEATQDAILKHEAKVAMLRKAVASATENSGGTNVLNPARLETAMEEMLAEGKMSLGKMFSKTEHAQLLGTMKRLAVALQKMPTNVPPEETLAAAQAIASAPLKAQPLLDALQLAKAPEVVKSMWDSVVAVGKNGAASAVEGAGLQGTEYVEGNEVQ